MKNVLIKRSSFLLILFTLTISSNAQEIFSSSGGEGNGSEGNISYTLGQLSCSHTSTYNGKINEGIQHPFEIIVINGMDMNDIGLNIAVSPNPVASLLKLEIGYSSLNNLKYQLFDITGSLLKEYKIVNNESYIQLNNLPSTIYILKITKNNKIIKSFKIIKK